MMSMIDNQKVVTRRALAYVADHQNVVTSEALMQVDKLKKQRN